ncbi:hypothetical protein GOBAR_AA39966 [Gossypium barbadense]|uniref:Inhibitor I9 domain-containing protein n=1 Tax=Gossypium barbadense TaxID=3634 RepID=A0A2P5VPH7_GOSBA|nr:hypothetical protein GOBAR_AA39966 [Gossypium barbadense]
MATDHTELLCFWLSFSISFIFIKLAQADNYIVQMDLSAMPKVGRAGFSACLTPAELEALKSTPGYVSSIKDRSVKVDTTHSFKFLGLNSNTGAWPVSNFGKDIIIGVIDTGSGLKTKALIKME